MGAPVLVLGRYALHGEIASGGFATIHLGRLVGPAGFSRTVAIKKLHPQFAREAEFVAMLLDEGRLAARVKHANVVATLDVLAEREQVFLVMDYVEGESLARLLRSAAAGRPADATGGPVPLPIALAIMVGVLAGLHAAHEATDEQGRSLELVHRDVSPQNVLVGVDGVPRLVDFGISKAIGRLQTTREGQLKGKLTYVAPEQILKRRVDRRADVYAAAVTLWQLLTGRRPFEGDEASLLFQILHDAAPPPSELVSGIPAELDGIVARGLAKEPEQRFATAQAMAEALEAIAPSAKAREVGAWVRAVASDALAERAELVRSVERSDALDEVEEASVAAKAVADETSQIVTTSAVEAAPAPRRRAGVVAAAVLVAAGGAALVWAGARVPAQWSEPSAGSSAAPASASSEPAATAPPRAEPTVAPTASSAVPSAPPAAAPPARAVPRAVATAPPATTQAKPTAAPVASPPRHRLPGEPDPGF